jgi:hypothetical protein
VSERPDFNPPQWARQNVTDPVSGLPNVIEPTEAKKDAGWNRAEKPARQFENWFKRGTGLWLEYLAGRDNAAVRTRFQDGTGTDILPELPWLSGDNPVVVAFCLFTAFDTSSGDLLFGGALADADGFENAMPIVSTGSLSVGSFSGRTLPIAGASAEDVDLILTVFPTRIEDVLNAEE